MWEAKQKEVWPMKEFVAATLTTVLYYFHHSVAYQLPQQHEFNLKKPSSYLYDLLLLGFLQISVPILDEEKDDWIVWKNKDNKESVIWKKLKEMMQVQSNTVGWDNIINEFADMPNKSSVWSIVRRLCLAFAIYSIWRERNNRVFRDEVCNWEVVLEMICETVRLKLMGLTINNTKAVQLVAKK
ncbi:reverse transcriptase zinc-binding domain-containing protein [Tanacetum coccineum]